MLLRDVARLALLGAALIAAGASASSKQQAPTTTATPTPPQPTQMDPSQALGLWKSSFGAVKIETNDQGGPGGVHGVWVYDRQGQEVIGYFAGALQGNVLQFTWQEPGDNGAPLVGAGYLVFDSYGQKFSGRWWTTSRDRTGEWTGWRQPTATAAPPPGPVYGGSPYGGSNPY